MPTFIVKVTVLDTTMRPIAGAKVQAFVPPQEALTDASGRATLNFEAPNQYRVEPLKVTADGYQEQSGSVNLGAPTRTFNLQPLRTTSTEPAKSLVSVKVMEPNGWPVQGALVKWLQYSAKTGADGVATLDITGNKSTTSYHTVIISAEGFETRETSVSFLGTAQVQLTRDPSWFANWVTIKDSSGAPVKDAMIYVGTRAFGPTGVDGKQWIQGKQGSATIKVKAPGFQESAQTENIQTPQGFPSEIRLAPVVTEARARTFTLSPSHISAQLKVCHVDGTPIELVSSHEGKAVTATKLPSGSYKIDMSAEGFQVQTIPVEVNEQIDEIPLPPLVAENAPTVEAKPTEPGTTLPDADSFTLAKDVWGLAVQGELEEATLDYEWIYPNSVDGKYFTATQARMYIGNLFVDELDTLQFAVQGNRIPIYGYSSADADAFGNGKRLVQGQILINFISEGYLYTVLREHDRVMAEPLKPADVRQEEFDRLCKKKEDLQAQIDSNKEAQMGYANADLEAQLTEIDERLTQLADEIGQAAIEEARKKYYTLRNGMALGVSKHPVYLPIAFNIEVELEGGGRKCKKWIENCVLTGCDLILDQSGNVVKEAYGFIARRAQ